MGGMGSGRWGWHRKRHTVESFQVVSIRDLKEASRLRNTKPLWRYAGILAEPDDPDPYRVWPGKRGPAGGLPVMEIGDAWIELEEWRPNLGGVSWRLVCPGCARTCLKLYSPPGARFPEYHCRRCWKLAYRSSQEAHKWDRGAVAAMLAPMYAAQGIPMRLVEKALRAELKANRWR